MSDIAVEPTAAEPVEAPAEPAVDAPEAAAVEAPVETAPAAPAQPSQADIAAFLGTQEGQQHLISALESFMPEEEPQVQELARPDPFGDNYEEQLDRYVEDRFARMLDERLGPIQPVLEHAQLGQAREWADTQFSGLDAETSGSFKAEEDRTLAIFVANTIGQRGGAPEQAFQQAAQLISARDRRIAQAAVDAYKAGFETADDGGFEPAAGGQAGIRTEDAPNGVLEAAERIRARRGA